MKNLAGGSVNDVILATVAGGVRRFLIEERDYEFDELDFRAMAPVSVRGQNERALWAIR